MFYNRDRRNGPRLLLTTWILQADLLQICKIKNCYLFICAARLDSFSTIIENYCSIIII